MTDDLWGDWVDRACAAQRRRKRIDWVMVVLSRWGLSIVYAALLQNVSS